MSARAAALAGLAAAAVLAGPFGVELGERWELDDLRRLLDIHPPAAVERWLYNPRERTARGLALLEAGEPAAALGALEAAGRIAPDDPRVLFNLGTGRLLADHGDAVGALERALRLEEGLEEGAEGAAEGDGLPPELRQRAFYNLGGAHLAAGDPAGAVAAYEEALRLEPSDEDAKHNLEVALRRLEETRLRLRSPQEAPGGRRPGEEAPSDEAGGTDPETPPDEEGSGGRDPGAEGPEADTRPSEGTTYGRRPLAGFDEQADLSAVQAAALLEAVEHLERRQRRQEALRAARRAGATEEDW
jgi:tetratricopeptide (TPR) repeat protein